MKKREKEEKKGKEIKKRERKINWFIRQTVDKYRRPINFIQKL